MKPIRAAALLVWLAGFAWPAFAQTHAYSVYADTDNDPATGCTIVTAAGSVSGIEAVLTADVSVDPVAVGGQRLARCQAGVLQAPVTVTGTYPYPVGFDQGADGFDVIELGAPLQLFGGGGTPGDWLLTFGAEGALLGGADLTGSALARGLGYAPVHPAFIPAASLVTLALLALALAIGTVWMARRRPQLLSILLVTSMLGLSGLAWAANYILDGGIGDWSGAPLLTDSQGDATQDEPPIDIRQAFAARQGVDVFFRIDVQETRLSVLIPPLFDTQFSIPENSPDGTALGSVRPATGGLSSILTLTQTSQTPATAFAFDPVTTALSVGATALLDFETHAQFQIAFSATLTSLPGYVLPVTVDIAIQDVNETPLLAAQGFTVLEHAATGTTVGTVLASDPDAGANGQLSYAITTVQSVFSIHAATGVITVADAAALALSASPYALNVRVSDGGSPALFADAAMTISVTDVNDPPSFTAGGNVTVDEDSGAYDAAWASAVSDGDDGSQTLTFDITHDNPALFAAGPVLDIVGNVGHLRFTPAADANGVANLTVVLRDDGGTANNGVNESAPANLQITVTAVNDAPSIELVSSSMQTTPEDTVSAQIIFTVTDVDNAPCSLTLGSTTSDAALFPSAGRVFQPIGDCVATGNSAMRWLTVLPGQDLFGNGETITITVQDAGGLFAVPPATLTLDVAPVNDVPVISAIADQTVAEDPAPAPGYPFTISDVDSAVACDDVTVATSLPALTSAIVIGGGAGTACTITITPAADAHGSTTITLDLTDAQGGTATQSAFDFTVTPVNDAPVNSVPGTQQVIAGAVAFSIANGNALGVSDVDADSDDIEVTLSVTNGTLTLTAVPHPDLAITGNGTAAITLLGVQAQINAVLDGLIYATSATGTDTLTFSSDDLGHSGAGGAQTDTDTVTLLIDEAPGVSASTPASGDTVASNVTLAIGFSEPVNVAAGAVTLTCGGANLITGGSSGSNVTSLAPTYAGSLPEGAACTLTVLAANVTDADAIDPPDAMPADHIVTFNVDAAPQVAAVSPANGAAGVAIDSTIVVDFSESVDIASAAAFSLECPTGLPVGYTVTTPASLPASATSFTLTPTSPLPAGTACTFRVNAAAVQDTDSFDPPDALATNFVSTFTTDTPPTVTAATPANNAVVGTAATITVDFSEQVNLDAGVFTLDCGTGPLATTPSSALPAGGVTSIGFTPDAALPEGAACTATVLASAVHDMDSNDPPDTMVANHVWNFSVDAAPAIVAIVPANGAIDVGLDANIVVTFSEPVNFTAAAFALACPGGTPVAFTVAGSGTATATIDPTPATLPIDTLCQFSVDASLVTDVDTADAPDAGTGTTTVGFTTVNDSAPTVATNPANGGSNIALNSNITVTFSEPVTLTGAWFRLSCETSGVRTSTGELTGTGITIIENTPDLVYTIDPTANLVDDEACTITIASANVTDNDAIDPPNELDGDASGDTTDGDADDYVAQFRTPDIAPSVTSTVPANNAVVSTAQAITVNFSEAVNLDAGVFALDCGTGPLATTPSVPLPTASAVSSIGFTPDAALSQGAACTATVLATAVHDADSNDPPDTMTANHVWNFSVDAAPSVTTTLPVNGTSNVDPTSNITIGFSESVTFDTTPNAANTSFDLECPGGTSANFSVATASPATTVTLNPLDSAVAGAACVLTVRASGILDADAIDPPDTMLADYTASFSFAAVANDDAYIATPHLTLNIGAASPQGGGVLANDIIGAGTITGFGFAPSCTGTAPGSQFDAGPANGRLTLNPDGSFSYEPPAAVVNGTRTFCYTVTGNDTANIVFTVQNTELVWFVDAASAAGGIGTQARPFQTLAAAASADTANDTIFLAFNASVYTGGITLEAGERLIGENSGSTLAAITGITPVDGSAFPALGGNAPTITCGSGNCITLNNSGAANTHILRGFIVGNASTGGTKIAGTTFGTLTVAELTLNGNGRALSLATGTLNGSFVDIDVSSGTGQGIGLDTVGGTWSVTNEASIVNVDGTALNIINTPSGGGASFAGGLSITKPSSGPGINFNANAAPINLGTVAITTGIGAALVIDNSIGTTTIASGSVSATGGPALNSSSSALALTLTGATSTNSPAQGIHLNGISGTVTISGGAISGSTGTAFLAQGTLGTTSYAGTISKISAGRLVDVGAGASGNLTLSGNLSCTVACGTGAGNHGLRVTGRTGGTLTFSGASKVFNSSATNPGMSLTSNTGATLNFTGGGLAITTTGGAGIEATGGGTVTVQGAVNTIVSTTGTALNVANTTIGGAGLNFRSITSSGGTNGIVLNSTGAGGLVVTGNGATGTGGTIQNKAIGISLTNTQAPSFSWMQLNDFSDYAIRGTTVAGFTLANSVINGANGNSAADDEGSVRFTNLTGSASVSNTSISGGFEDNFRLVNNTGSLNRLTFSNVTIGTNSITDGNDGITLEAAGSAIVNVTVQDSTFTAARGDLFQYNHIGTGSGDLVINNSTFSNNHPGIATGGGGISLFTSGLAGGNVTMSVTGNTFRDSVGDAIVIVKSAGPAIQSGSFSNNAVGVTGIPNSGATEGSTLRLQTVGQGTLTWSLTDNSLRGYNNFGFEMRAGGGANPEGGTINNTLTGNVIAEPGDTAGVASFPKNGLHYNIGTNVGDTFQACANLGGTGVLRNDIHLSGKDAIPPTGLGDIDFRIRNRRAGINIRLPGYAGPATASNTDINNYVTPRNDLGGTPFGAAHGLVGTFSGTGTTCP